MPLKVYYLDDEELLGEIFAEFFSSDQVAVTAFSEVGAMFEVIAHSAPDLIFIDYRLPGTTGDEVAKRIDPAIPKILLTGEITVQTSYHFEKILAKPFDNSEILRLLDFYAGQRST